MFGVDSVKADSQRKCAKELLALDSSHRRLAMVQMCFDRIEQKQAFLVDKFHDTENWNETAYYMLLRSLDIKANRPSYERLAQILTFSCINKVSYDIRAIEALLLGCSGLLVRLVPICNGNREIHELNEMFTYLSHKYNLEQMRADEWQLIGQKGDNHPIIRLLQLASLLAGHHYLLSDILDCRTKRDVERLFCNTSVPRWAYRFLADEESEGAITRTKAHMLGINVVAQIQIFYSEYTLRSDLDSRGIDLLEQLPAERNQYILRWEKLGIKADSALESQALLQLTKEYCSSLACERCPLRRFVGTK